MARDAGGGYGTAPDVMLKLASWHGSIRSGGASALPEGAALNITTHIPRPASRGGLWPTLGLVALALSLLAGGARPGPAAAAPTDSVAVTAPNNVTIAESDDYMTQVLGAPADMSKPDSTYELGHLTPPTVSNGVWSSQTIDPYASIFFLHQSFDVAMSNIGEHNGVNYPIASQRFSHLRLRMYSSVADRMIVYWFPARSFTPGGNSNYISTQAGWHVYDIDLNATGNSGTGTWFNGNWGGLRFDPFTGLGHTGATVQLDWVRLTPPTGSSTTISWTGSGAGTVSLYLATSPGGADEMQIASGLPVSGSYNWNSAGMAAGTYYIRARLNAASGVSGPLVVNQAPVLTLTAPSPSSGEDYATTRLGHSWLLGSLSDLVAWYNITNISNAPGYLQATATNGDPSLWLSSWNTAAPIDSARYHYLTYNLFLGRPNEGPVGGSYRMWNGGTRTIWSQTNAPLNWQTSKATIAWYDRWLRLAMDLRNPANLEPGSTQGWTGLERIVRIDPHEEADPNVEPAFFRVGGVRLTGDQTVPNGGATTISWSPLKAGGSVTLRYSTSPAGGGTVIATLPAVQSGYIWTVNGLANGNYWITADVSDGLNTFHQVSSTPIVVTGNRACPTTYSDVPPSFPFYSYISNLGCRNIVEGYGDNTFLPYANITRGALAQWVVRARGWALDTGGATHFSDVYPTDPLYPYIETAYSHGVISGYADGSFHPYSEVTRGQMSKMIVNAWGWQINVTGGPHFTDVPGGNVFYSYIETLYNHGLISGYADGTFRWGASNTRAQLAKVISNALGQ
jgi:hypothetical protein